MTKRIQFCLMAVALMLLALPALTLASEEIDETRELNADAVVSISNISGSVSITGWERDELEITGTLGKGTERLDVLGDADRMEIEVVIPEHSRNVEGSHLEIRLPSTCRVRVSTVNADIDIARLSDELDLNTVNGDISVEGNIKEIALNTVSGDVTLKTTANVTMINNVSGDIEIEGGAGTINLNTVSGDIRMSDTEAERISFNSVSGDLHFAGSFADDGRYNFDAQSGTIRLMLSGELNADLWVSSFSGDIDSDFGGKVRRTSKYGPGKELEYRAGNGGAEIEIETFSGDVELIKR